jgi:DNA-binding CsgD family transcriptional regulator
MGLWLDRQRECSAAQIGETMLTALGGGWLVFDATGKILRLSPNLATYFQAAEGLPLKFGEPAISSAFSEAFAQAVAGEEPVAFSFGQCEMLLTRIENDNALAILARLRTTPCCALISAQAVAHHFGISTSEARLAILICDGHSLKAAAAMLGWTEESTRTCSKSLFARLGVSGQPNLVRRMLNSSVWYKGSR